MSGGGINQSDKVEFLNPRAVLHFLLIGDFNLYLDEARKIIQGNWVTKQN